MDWSPGAVREAAARAPEFGSAGRASFAVGDLAATGLETGSVDGAVCADAVFFATERVAVFAEMTRVLRLGARFMFTADESEDPGRPAAVPDWAPIVEAGGLIVESREEIPRWRENLQGMYDSWLASIDEIRRTLGDESADELIEEATEVGPTLPGRTGVLCVTRRR